VTSEARADPGTTNDSNLQVDTLITKVNELQSQLEKKQIAER